MQQAIALGRKGMHQNEGGPFGCVIVKDDVVIGQGWNRVTSANDPTAHAEIMAIRDACKNLQTFQLAGCELYTSCEPCPMCLGAIYWARPSKIYFAASHTDAAAAGFDDSFIYQELALPAPARKIAMECIMQGPGADLFTEWVRKENKQPY